MDDLFSLSPTHPLGHRGAPGSCPGHDWFGTRISRASLRGRGNGLSLELPQRPDCTAAHPRSGPARRRPESRALGWQTRGWLGDSTSP